MACALSRRVVLIEDSIRLLGYLADQLKFLQPSVHSLIQRSADQPGFADLVYLQSCRDCMAAGERFGECWQRCVEDCRPQLGSPAAQELAQLSAVLGATDLESQLTALAYTAELLQHYLDEAREYREKHAKLYRTLGVLAGVSVVIMLA